jgi:hypothetical protein
MHVRTDESNREAKTKPGVTMRWARQISSLLLAGIALVLAAEGASWHPSVREIFQSRAGTLLLSGWIMLLAMLVHPELRAGLRRGIREFRIALCELIETFGKDDDDGGPKAA